METFLKAKEEGKIRHIGFSAHTTKGALEMMKGFPFDWVMFPLSYVDYLNFDFGKAVVEMARQRGVAVLAMKAIYAGAWPEGGARTRKWWYRPLEKDDQDDWRCVSPCRSPTSPPRSRFRTSISWTSALRARRRIVRSRRPRSPSCATCGRVRLGLRKEDDQPMAQPVPRAIPSRQPARVLLLVQCVMSLTRRHAGLSIRGKGPIMRPLRVVTIICLLIASPVILGGPVVRNPGRSTGLGYL